MRLAVEFRVMSTSSDHVQPIENESTPKYKIAERLA